MSACFLWFSHHQEYNPLADPKILIALSKWVPFQSEKITQWRHLSGKVSALIWESHREGARGSYHASDSNRTIALSYTGWWRESDQAPLNETVAQVMLSSLCGSKTSQVEDQCERGLADYIPRQGWGAKSTPHYINSQALEALHNSPGQFSVAIADQEGRLHGINGAFGGIPMYYAQTTLKHTGTPTKVSLVSNRASLISAFIEGGQPASPRPESLAWLLARHEQPLGDSTSAWSGVHRLYSGERLQADNGVLTIKNPPLLTPRIFSYESLYEGFLWRTQYLKRLPKVPFAMALTGGFDSRLILAAIIETNQLESIDRYFINADPKNVEAKVAQLVADTYHIELNIDRPGRWQDHDEPILDRLRRHNFLVEYMCNAWDIQSGPFDNSLPRHGLISGHFGEIYRSHFEKWLSHSKHLLQFIYPNHLYNDRYQLLTKEMLRYCQKRATQWLSDHFDAGIHPHVMFDEIHRYARMEGWATQNQNVEGLGWPSLSLLPCVSTRLHYEAQSLAEKRRPTLHYHLTKRVDDQLWRLPFANKSWPLALHKDVYPHPIPSVKGAYHHLGAQLRMWSTQGAELCQFILDTPQNSPFWLVVERHKLERKVKDIKTEVTAKKVKALMATAAISIALTESLEPVGLSRAKS
jgi:hypothetical protein